VSVDRARSTALATLFLLPHPPYRPLLSFRVLHQVKTYRERARALSPHITRPEMVCPITIHPAFEKAGHFFDVKMVHAPVDDATQRVDLASLKALITPNTIAIVVSAPQCVQQQVASVR
jgi:glutamate/tyrosine decarboxylase-like PLP-dependent enzyme